MNLPQFCNESWTTALVNHLWQSTVVVAIAWVLAAALKKNHAGARYWVWFVASVKFLLPFSLLITAGEWLRSLIPVPATRPAVASVMEQVTQPFGQTASLDAGSAPIAGPHGYWLPTALVALWVCGVIAIAIRFARGWCRVYAAKRGAMPIGKVQGNRIVVSDAPSTAENAIDIAAFAARFDGLREKTDAPRAKARNSFPAFPPVPIHTSDPVGDCSEFAAEVPVLSSPEPIELGVVGIFRPALLIPEGILEKLTAEQLRAVLAHEVCHVQRRDNLTSAIHMVVEALFWFHPLVWWIGIHLIDERERACDEAVVQAEGEAEVYAEGILTVCKYFAESPLACVSGVTGADLKKRIVRIMSEQIGQKLNLSKKVLLTAVSLMAMAAPIMIGLLHARQSHAQSTPPRAVPQVFDVASIRPNQTGGESRRAGASPGGLFTATNVPLRLLIARAYGVPESQIQNAPSWVDTQTYDIAARADTSLEMTPDELRPCLQTVLEDRFRLTIHRETRTGSVYSLELGKNGPKFKQNPGSVSPAISASSGSGVVDLRGTRVTMARLAEYLSDRAGRPVLDNTGLNGYYDFRVQWATEDQPVSSGPSIFAALEEQLGLKLIAAKGPIETIVIDHVEKPSPN